jgi:hypothetical protein
LQERRARSRDGGGCDANGTGRIALLSVADTIEASLLRVRRDEPTLLGKEVRMLRRCMGAIAVLFALGGTPALAAGHVRCRDGTVRHVEECNRYGGGVAMSPRYHGRRMARCRDGSVDRGPRACWRRGGVRRWI